jgi:hypothetical protein
MLQAGRLRVPFSMMSLDLFNLLNPSSRAMALGSTQSLTEMSTKNILGGGGGKGGRCVRRTRLFYLQAGRSPVQVPMRWIFSIYLILPSRTMVLGSTHPLRGMSTMNFPGGKKRPARWWC